MDQQTRLQDYLDDKLQAAADFETLDSLIQNVQTQQDLLKKQLIEAQQDHDSADWQSREHAASIKQKAESFQKQQGDIDRTLMIVTQSEASDDAVAKFDKVMEDLRRYDIATGYIDLLQRVDTLSSDISKRISTDVDGALHSYRQLVSLSTALGPLQEAAEGAAPHLTDMIIKTASSNKRKLQERLSTELGKTLKRIGWPKTYARINDDTKDEWTLNVGRLLDLQQPDLVAHDHENKERTSKDEPLVLLPLEVMIQPLALRFQYHFSGDRMTNRVDKPEYFLTHVLDLISDYAGFVQEYLQPQLFKHFRGSELAFTPAYIDATSSLITAVLPFLRQKLKLTLSEVSRQPNLFSNLIHEVIVFDERLLDEWDYTPWSPSTPFRGMSHCVLSTLGYFPAWFAVERDFALSRYEAIIAERETGELDFDSVDASMSKPTKAAIRVNDLLETITDRYRPISSFNHKIKFLIDIQIAIFDRFHSRLHEGLEAYLTQTSTVARTVHGINQADATELGGVKGLDRLCRVFGSAEYLEKAMSDWSEDVFFLDLWEELQYRSQHPDSIKGDLSMRDIATKTSTLVNGTPDESEDLQGALFDETAASYHRLRVRSENILIETLTYDIRNALKSYTRVNTWASMSSAGHESSLTAELDGAARLLDEYLEFLSKALGRAPLRRISRQLGQSIQSTIWDSLLIRHSFSTAGATQLAADVRGLWRIFDRYLGAGQGKASMLHLAEGLVVLGLPVTGETPVDKSEQIKDPLAVKKPGLWEVERRVFASNESARDVLEDLGLYLLNESDAREVLKRRIEIST